MSPADGADRLWFHDSWGGPISPADEPDKAIAERWPGVQTWYGKHTRSWWAYVPGPPRLVEAATFRALAGAITRALACRGR
ncbi:hypothetical protein [Actinomadura madurae]|uniref:Uncharacterized protein n=1 Tax=Actinomadura madurae TaxID=1993 RepID=A0A1I5L1H1_9ACTN|nr:hypothetical protein [Actinomadura madurae]SFO91169.1 hypothetical protein SAMN04489713_110215 [Actinomadura madurae]SPT49367.1 Uncharacterised protein [Actinomadura madurae]